MIRTYSQLIKFKTFEERFQYLKLDGAVGQATFGFDRYLNQQLYRSHEWKKVRDEVIVRDNGCDLAMEGFDIYGRVYVHHMNPILINDIRERNEFLFNPEYLVCVSFDTHNAIHYGDESLLPREPVERTPNDTTPWKTV